MSRSNQILVKYCSINWRRVGRLLVLFTGLFVTTSACIEPFFAEIEGETKIITIEGSIVKGNDIQKVIISNTTTLLYQQFIPIRNCEVKVTDDLNNEFIYHEEPDGTYEVVIPDDQLQFNRKYKISVKTSSGKEYESEFETLLGSSSIDTVYYDVEAGIEDYTGEELSGVQFYVDVKAADTISRYFRWNISETYEYTSTGPISYFFLDGSLEPIPPRNIWAVYRCWITEDVPGIYLSNTVNLTMNEKKKIPLNYVSSKSDRLKIKYSLLLEQYTMDEGAYNYWLQNKTATEDPGGLYTKQPARPITNLRSKSDAEERVLGYFWVSSKTEQRIFIPRINSIKVHDEICELRPFDFIEDGQGPFPIYVRLDEKTGLEMIGDPYCFDCTLRGGSITKPDFWE